MYVVRICILIILVDSTLFKVTYLFEWRLSQTSKFPRKIPYIFIRNTPTTYHQRNTIDCFAIQRSIQRKKLNTMRHGDKHRQQQQYGSSNYAHIENRYRLECELLARGCCYILSNCLFLSFILFISLGLLTSHVISTHKLFRLHFVWNAVRFTLIPYIILRENCTAYNSVFVL